MALQGTLDTFALADLVRLLATTEKTGELTIDGDRGPGRLWFASGQLVGGEPLADELVDVVFALLRNTDGEFGFAADIPAPDATEPQSALDVLAAAEARLEEWAPVEALVPSPAVAVSLRDDIDGDEVTIDRATWHRLVAVAAGVTAGDLAARLELDEHATAFTIRDLVEAGLVAVGDEVVTPVEDPTEPVAEDPIVADDGPAAPLALVPDPVVEAEPEPEPVVAAEPVPAADPLVAELPDLELEPPYSFGGWGSEGPPPVTDEAPALADPTPADPAALGPWEPLLAPVEPSPVEPVVPTADPLVALDAPAPAPAADAGSYAVDLDSALGGDLAGHSYLGSAGAPRGLPEPLLEALPVAAEVAPESDPVEEVPPTPTPRAEDLGVPLDSLSPAAARALTAAAQADDPADDEADETDAGRRVLRRIIGSGKG